MILLQLLAIVRHSHTCKLRTDGRPFIQRMFIVYMTRFFIILTRALTNYLHQ